MRGLTLEALRLGAVVLLALPASAQAPRVPPSIHPELLAHARHFERSVLRVGERVYAAVGWGPANTIWIDGEGGVILVDVGESVESGRRVAARLREVTEEPIVAVVYTHADPAHTAGGRAFVDEDQVRAGDVEILARAALRDEAARPGGALAPIRALRAAYGSGIALPLRDRSGMSGGTGPLSEPGTSGFQPPTRSFGDDLELVRAGVRMRLIHVPGDTPTGVAVWLPELGVLLGGDVLPGPALPDLGALHGVPPRDPLAWVRSIDRLRELGAEHLVPSHGRPLSGAARVEEVLRNTRDAIQFLHDQSVRHMNRGLGPAELVEAVRLPPHLADEAPYLREYRGTVADAARAIYAGSLGWFEADPVTLAPTPPAERARRLVAAMNGRDVVLGRAREALAARDPQWAAELATLLVRSDAGDRDARLVKADAFRRLGYAQLDARRRSWYLTAALELEGDLDLEALRRSVADTLAAPDRIAAQPARAFVAALPTRLRAERTLDVEQTLAIRFLDVDEDYAIEIRRGVALLHERLPAIRALTIALDKSLTDAVSRGETTLVEALRAGRIGVVEGVASDVERFLGWFDPPFPETIRLTGR
ncbi:MAG: alkyl sulfatase dimerization domain-containing protein [Myxococcota bacterium]|nr:alkyl sulfatase dimerization domain-containing protein [Myxococcota bacterium]